MWLRYRSEIAVFLNFYLLGQKSGRQHRNDFDWRAGLGRIYSRHCLLALLPHSAPSHVRVMFGVGLVNIFFVGGFVSETGTPLPHVFFSGMPRKLIHTPDIFL